MSTGSPDVSLERDDARHPGPDAGYARHYFPRSRLGRIPQPVALIEQVLTQNSYALLLSCVSVRVALLGFDQTTLEGSG